MTEIPNTPPPAPGGGAPVPRDPILILILNLLFGGVGYIVLGRKKKGVVALVVWFIAAVLTCGWGGLVVAAITAADGYMQAQHVKNGRAIDDTTFFNQTR